MEEKSVLLLLPPSDVGSSSSSSPEKLSLKGEASPEYDMSIRRYVYNSLMDIYPEEAEDENRIPPTEEEINLVFEKFCADVRAKELNKEKKREKKREDEERRNQFYKDIDLRIAAADARVAPYRRLAQERSISMYERLIKMERKERMSIISPSSPSLISYEHRIRCKDYWDEHYWDEKLAEDAISNAKADPTNFNMWKQREYRQLLLFIFGAPTEGSPYARLEISRHPEDGHIVRVRGCSRLPFDVNCTKKKDKEYVELYEAVQICEEAMVENPCITSILEAAEKIAWEKRISLDVSEIRNCANEVCKEKLNKKFAAKRRQMLQNYIEVNNSEAFQMSFELIEIDKQVCRLGIPWFVPYYKLRSAERQTAMKMISEEYDMILSYVEKNPMSLGAYLKLKLCIAREMDIPE